MALSDEAYGPSRTSWARGTSPAIPRCSMVRGADACRARPPRLQSLHAPRGGHRHARVHGRGAGGRPLGKQVQVRHQTPWDRLVSLGVRDVRRPGHRPARPAAHEQDRDRREERHRHRGAVRIHAQLHAEAIKRGWSCNIIGAGASCSVVAGACAYSGIGAGTIWMGGNAENVLGMEWVTPAVRSSAMARSARVTAGSVARAPVQACAASCAARLAPRRTGCLHQVRRQAGPLAGLHRLAGVRDGPRLSSAHGQDFPRLHGGRARLGRVERLYYKIYDNEIGYSPSSVQSCRRRPGAGLLAHVQRPDQATQRYPGNGRAPGIAELTEEMRISLQIVMAAVRKPTSNCRTRSSTPSSPKWAAGKSSATANRTWPSSPTCT